MHTGQYSKKVRRSGDIVATLDAPPNESQPIRHMAPPTTTAEAGPRVVHTPALDPLAEAAAGPGRKGVLRRRLEKLRRERDAQLVALGTLVVDAHRRTGSAKADVIEKRAAAVAELDRQVMELTNVVEGERDRVHLHAGVAGTCVNCARILATEDRYCPSCGTKR
jgi:hypothetical protein